MKTNYLLVALAMLVMLCSFNNVTDEEMMEMGASQGVLEMMKADTIYGVTGVVSFPVCHASVLVPEEFVFLDVTQSRKLLIDYWGNNETAVEGLLGTMVPTSVHSFCEIAVAFVISYDNCGYIKDDDAESIDYDDLLSYIRKGMEEENKKLPYEHQAKLLGWAAPPTYLKDLHTLRWAKRLSFGGDEVVNYDMRILGREGMVSINAVVPPNNCEEVMEIEKNIIRCLSYDDGYTYADFDPKRDRVSEWTLGGLVAGTYALAKSGLLAKLGVVLLKFWKLIALAFVGLVAGISKFFKRKKIDDKTLYLPDDSDNTDVSN